MKTLFKFILNQPMLLVLCVLLLLFFIFQVKQILLLLFVCYIIMSAFSKGVEILTKKGIPRVFSIILIYIITFICILTIIAPLVFLLNSQISLLINNFPSYLYKFADLSGVEVDTKALIASIFNNIGDNILSLTKQTFSGVLSLLTMLIISFYLLLDEEKIKKKIVANLGETNKLRVLNTLKEVEEKLGAWTRGQLLLCFVIGFLTWVGLSILGVEYALSLALIAGALEILPTLGPILSSIPAIIIAVNISPTLGIVVAFLYLGIQLLENNLIVPKIMQQAVGLHPIIVITAILVGGQFMGVIGSLLAIPLTLVIIVIFKNTYKD